MIRRFRTSIFACFIALVFAVSLHAADSGTTLLTILHVNDYHGRINPTVEKAVDPQWPVGGAAYLAAVIKEARANNPHRTLLLAAGDMFQGSAVSNLAHGAPVVEIMNELKFDAMCLGNHEFDWGVGVLEQIRREAHFPFLSANIVDSKGHLLPGIKRYAIITRGHAKVAVIGVTTPDTKYTTKPDNVKGLTFLSPETVLPGLIRKVKQEGATIVVLLSHLGLDADKRVASAVPGIDVIVGGHSHTVVPKPLKVDNTVILQAGAYGLYLGVLELMVDEATGRPLSYANESGLRLVTTGPQNKTDGKAALIVKKYNDKVKQKFSTVVGETSIDLSPARQRESNLGNMTTDAMRESTGARIAFENSGGIRATIPAGKITMEELYTAFPFDNLLVSMTLTGKEVREALEQGGTMEFGGLQVSGINVTYDLNRPAGEHVARAEVNGEPLDDAKSYSVVTNDFLAAGGDKVTALREGKDIAYGDTLLDALTAYLKKHSPVAPSVQGRIRFAE